MAGNIEAVSTGSASVAITAKAIPAPARGNLPATPEARFDRTLSRALPKKEAAVQQETVSPREASKQTGSSQQSPAGADEPADSSASQTAETQPKRSARKNTRPVQDEQTPAPQANPDAVAIAVAVASQAKVTIDAAAAPEAASDEVLAASSDLSSDAAWSKAVTTDEIEVGIPLWRMGTDNQPVLHEAVESLPIEEVAIPTEVADNPDGVELAALVGDDLQPPSTDLPADSTLPSGFAENSPQASSDEAPAKTGRLRPTEPVNASEPQVASEESPAREEPETGEQREGQERPVDYEGAFHAVKPERPEKESGPTKLEFDIESNPRIGQANSPVPANHADSSSKPATPQTPPPPETRFAEVNFPKIVSGVRSELVPQGGTMQIRLDPPELGAMQVRVEMRDGVLTASFQTVNDDATRLLSHSLHQLKAALESQGVNVERLQVEQVPREKLTGGAPDDGQPQQQPQDQSFQHEQQRREMLQRMWRRLANGNDPLDMMA